MNVLERLKYDLEHNAYHTAQDGVITVDVNCNDLREVIESELVAVTPENFREILGIVRDEGVIKDRLCKLEGLVKAVADAWDDPLVPIDPLAQALFDALSDVKVGDEKT